jgi:hypothetical protein
MNEPPSRRIEAEELRGWLSEAGVNPLPSDDRIKLLAYVLTQICCIDVGRKFEPFLGPAKKYGRLFLRHLPKAIEKLKTIPGKSARRDLEAMLAAEERMRLLLERCDYQLRPLTWHGQAGIIAKCVQDTLEQTGKSYRDVNEGSPLCLIVAQVLAAIDNKKSSAAVSDALRGRRGNKGRKRNAERP